MRELLRRHNCWHPMHDTGPLMLTDVVNVIGARYGVRVLGWSYFYPIDWHASGKKRYTVQHMDRGNTSLFNEERILKMGDENTYSGTTWRHSWESRSREWRWR